MKVVNIILCVLILLLGIASAVFSYFLFEKRSQFVTGWAKMADTVSKTAAALDKNSGTKIAAKLTPQALAHENYSNLDKLLPELLRNSADIIAERDKLADALSNISRSIRMREVVPAEKLKDLNTYSAQTELVVKGVYDAIDSRDRSYRNLANAFRSQLNINVDTEKLLAGNQEAFAAYRKEMAARNARKNAYERSLREIAGLLGASQPNFGNGKFEGSLKEMLAAVRAYRDKSVSCERELRQEKSRTRSNERKIASLENDKKKLNAVLDGKNLEIEQFDRALGIPDAARAEKPWLPGSAEARERATGKITAVNSDYGYIAMNLGKYSVVRQTIGNRTLEINPKIEPGLEVIITRSGKKNKTFIARTRISQVGETASIADIPPDADKIMVGDTVTIAPQEKAAGNKETAAKPAVSAKPAKK